MQAGETQKINIRTIILAAGMGTRMKHLSVHTPKALVDIAGKPLLERVISYISQSGVKEVIVNLHHHASRVQTFLEFYSGGDIRLHTSDETEALLDTGGGIQKAGSFLSETPHFLVWNVDILSDLDIQALYRVHLQEDNLVTLAVRKRPSGRFFRFDKQGLLAEWLNVNMNESVTVKDRIPGGPQLAYSGIMMAKRELLDLMPAGKYSLTPFLISLAEKHRIGHYCTDQGYWLTVGNPKQREEAERFFRERGE